MIVLPQGMRQDMTPLIDAYRSNAITAELLTYDNDRMFLSHTENFCSLGAGFDALLIAGPWRRSPRQVLPGPFICSGKSRVPVAWLPVKDQASFHTAITTAAAVQSRAKERPGVAVLAQRHPRFLSVASRVQHVLADSNSVNVFKWTSDLLLKEEMIKGLGCGIGCAMYLGHGRPIGWVGYYGTRIHDFTPSFKRPMGTLLSLCCLTASRKRVGLSFAETMVLNGITASAFAAVSKTMHLDNTRWAIRMCDSLNNGITTLAELVLDACPPEPRAWRDYRIIGDPFAPVSSCKGSTSRARAIRVYA